MARTALATATVPAIRPPAAPARTPLERVETRRPTLEVVGPRRRFRTGPTVALGAVFAFAIAFALVACQVLLVQGQQNLDGLDADIASSTDRYQELRLEVAQLEAPERIVDAASSLGMVTPPEVTYLTPTGAITVSAGAGADTGSGTADDLTDTAERLDDYASTRPNLEGG